MNVSFYRSPHTCVSMCSSPLKTFVYEFSLTTLAVLGMSYLGRFGDGR